MDNRHGLVVNTRLAQAVGLSEPEAALVMAAETPGSGRVAMDADNVYYEMVQELRESAAFKSAWVRLYFHQPLPDSPSYI